MTLTAILPTLRASIPDPLDKALWPATTLATLTDVVIDDVSMCHLVELSGTPAVYRSRTSPGVVVVMRVLDAATTGHRTRSLSVDPMIEGVTPMWSELRLIGRVSTARVEATAVCEVSGSRSGLVMLPADISPGDIVVVPCAVDGEDLPRHRFSEPADSAVATSGGGLGSMHPVSEGE
ncbi:hypothetical protein [Williamsia sp. 1135]|uniref:hypothetical protein n=1 Tax=Williamsia sp. 1135 TaxID=1889262 RepID=UPI000A105EB6|nr:hypothetical protein [Williamsia sp. 1135]ORM29132.1 hypothetical protein BFL43_20005 [Williamsia sp. 1135]